MTTFIYNVATNKMSSNGKRLQRFLQQPTALHYREIESLLLRLGFEKIETKGSHKKFKHPNLKSDLILPVHNNDCKPFYKKYVQKILIQTFRHLE